MRSQQPIPHAGRVLDEAEGEEDCGPNERSAIIDRKCADHHDMRYHIAVSDAWVTAPGTTLRDFMEVADDLTGFGILERNHVSRDLYNTICAAAVPWADQRIALVVPGMIDVETPLATLWNPDTTLYCAGEHQPVAAEWHRLVPITEVVTILFR